MIYGYVRVSSRDQNEDRQMIAMREMDVPERKRNIFAAPETLPNITQELYGNLMSLCDYAYDVLVDDEDISEWNYEIDKLDGRLENYCSSYKKNPSEKECLVEALIDCIEEYPFDISYYVSLYNLDATPYSKIKELRDGAGEEN